jgi:hypothetical protein
MLTAFLIGAGASKAFNYPTTVEFMDIAQQKNLPEPFKQVTDFLRTTRKTIDIEMVLGEIQDTLDLLGEISIPGRFKQHLFHSSGQLANAGKMIEYSRSLDRLTREINKLVYETYWKGPEDEAKVTYRSLAQAFGPSIDLFTTNYDLCIEHAFSDATYDDKSFTDALPITHETCYGMRSCSVGVL